MAKALVLVLSGLVMFGCQERDVRGIEAATSPTNAGQGAQLPQGVAIVPATSEQCLAGGVVYVVYLDENGNGALDEQEKTISASPVCNGVNGTNGSNGRDGTNGTDGRDGTNGSNGANGADGRDAVLPGTTPVGLIHACGDTVAYKEVLLLLANGQVLGSFSQDTGGTMTRLALLPDGTYMNTDTSGCVFTLSTSGTTRSISWGNQVRQSWTVTP